MTILPVFVVGGAAYGKDVAGRVNSNAGECVRGELGSCFPGCTPESTLDWLGATGSGDCQSARNRDERITAMVETLCQAMLDEK